MGQLNFENNRALDGNGQPVPYAKRYVYYSDRGVLCSLFGDQNLTDTIPNPMIADKNGDFETGFLQAGIYRVVITTNSGNIISNTDEVVVTEDEYGFVRRFPTVSEMLTDISMSYENGRFHQLVRPGEIIDVAQGGHRYKVAPPEDTGAHLTTTGGVRLYASDLGSVIDITAFGATGDGATDSTLAIQNAINVASHSNDYSVYVPEGHFLFDTIYLFHDAALNPGFLPETSPNRHGRIRFCGQGALAISQLRNYNPNYGSILEATGDGVIVASEALGHGSNPYPARKFEAEGITFVANNTGYVIEAAACPMFHLNRCAVLQRNASGNGLKLKSAWYTLIERTEIFGVPGTTGTGVAGGSDTFGGIYVIARSMIDTWQDGFDWQNGDFSNIHFQDTSIQNCTRNGIRGSGGLIRHLMLTNCYFEGQSRQVDIRGIGNTIRQLIMRGTFFLCGDGANLSYVNERVIDLDQPHGIEITGTDVFRLRVPFCRITSLSNSGSVSGFVSGLHIVDDTGTPSSQISLFEGKLPEFGPAVVWPGYNNGYNDSNSDIKLFDETADMPATLMDRRTGIFSTSRLALGEVRKFPGATTAITVTPTEATSIVDVEVATGLGVAVRLPNQDYVPSGRLFMLRSDPASIGALVVRNNSNNSLVISLSAGQSCLVVFDAATRKYLPFLADQLTPQSDIASLSDSTGGTAGTAVSSISGSGADVGINDNFATLAGQIETILDRLRTSGLLT